MSPSGTQPPSGAVAKPPTQNLAAKLNTALNKKPAKAAPGTGAPKMAKPTGGAPVQQGDGSTPVG